ncbi:unnamed protein product, partial [marine sediment metagenome]
MKINPTQMHTLELTCKRCKETKYAIEFKKYTKPLRVYDICMSCVNERSRHIYTGKGELKSAEFLSMYKCKKTKKHKICYHQREFMYKKLCKKRLEMQKREQIIKDAGFSLHKQSDV